MAALFLEIQTAQLNPHWWALLGFLSKTLPAKGARGKGKAVLKENFVDDCHPEQSGNQLEKLVLPPTTGKERNTPNTALWGNKTGGWYQTSHSRQLCSTRTCLFVYVKGLWSFLKRCSMGQSSLLLLVLAFADTLLLTRPLAKTGLPSYHVIYTCLSVAVSSFLLWHPLSLSSRGVYIDRADKKNTVSFSLHCAPSNSAQTVMPDCVLSI